MSEDASKKLSREERLAAKLRENLRRRKAQSRAIDEIAPDSHQDGVSKDNEAG